MPDGTAPSLWGADKKDVIFMSHYVARVGELIIKPEYRKDFGHMFFAEYDNVKDKWLFNYIAQFEVAPEYSMDFLQLRYWNHNDYKKEWVGRYPTCYDEKTGHFVYGVSYNIRSRGWAMNEFFKLMEKMTQKEIYIDYRDESMDD